MTIETEVVIGNFRGEDDQKCAKAAIIHNLDEIVAQAYDDIKITNVSVIKTEGDLPKSWTPTCLPWYASQAFGKRPKETRIAEFLKQEPV